MTVDIALQIQPLHSAILGFIATHFAEVAKCSKISLLKHDQLLLILRNKYVHLPKEDIAVTALDTWLASNQILLAQQPEVVNKLVECINWPAVELGGMVEMLKRQGGCLKKMPSVVQRVQHELCSRSRCESPVIQPRYC
jgi:hypothetical protein